MLLRILPLIFLLFSLPTFVIVRRYWRRRHLKWAKYLLLSVNGLIFLAAAILAFDEGYTQREAMLKSYVVLAFMFVAIPQTWLAIFLFVGKRFKRRPQIRKIIDRTGWITMPFIVILLLHATFVEPYEIKVKEVTFRSNKLPRSFEGFRIAVVSDLHVGSYDGDTTFISKLTDSINSLDADLIAVVGDVVNFSADEWEPYAGILSRLRAKHGVMSVMGNHDYMGYRKWPTPADSIAQIMQLCRQQEEAGWHLLRNASYIVRETSGDSIVILGSENYSSPPFPHTGDLKKAQQGINENSFQILFTHDPYQWHYDVVNHPEIPFTISGHTHGAQMNLFGWSPAVFKRKEWGGLYEQDGHTLFVTQGTGMGFMLMRILLPPEIVVVTLRTSAQPAK